MQQFKYEFFMNIVYECLFNINGINITTAAVNIFIITCVYIFLIKYYYLYDTSCLIYKAYKLFL